MCFQVKSGRRYGRAVVGHQATIVERYQKGKKYNVYLAVSVRGVVAYWVTTRSATEEVFGVNAELLAVSLHVTLAVVSLCVVLAVGGLFVVCLSADSGCFCRVSPSFFSCFCFLSSTRRGCCLWTILECITQRYSLLFFCYCAWIITRLRVSRCVQPSMPALIKLSTGLRTPHKPRQWRQTLKPCATISGVPRG